MISADNCIYFSEELANIYDATRPFKRRSSNSPVLQEICQMLIDAQPDAESITLLEVGAGTGRVTFPLADHYERIAADRKKCPTLTIYCVEKSPAMLNKLKDKMGTAFEKVIIDAGEPRDIRDAFKSDKRFDGIIAHWFFHVVSDWRVAVYAIDRLLKPAAQVFLLNEQSDLYRAIDGDYAHIEEETVRGLWHGYHLDRSQIDLEINLGSPILPPRFRLGSMVIDDRVEQMFSNLGWSKIEDFKKPDVWKSPMSLEFVINNVIRQRAFTNMRLLKNEQQARLRYENLADKLLAGLTPGEKKFNWQIETVFTARVLRRTEELPTQDTSRDLLLHVLRDTLGRRWKRRMEHAYNREALWRRLFANTWERLNRLDGNNVPCGALGKDVADIVLGLYASVPFAGTGIPEKPSVIAACHDAVKPLSIENAWINLTSVIETHDPFCLSFTKRAEIHQGETPTTCMDVDETRQPIIHPQIHSVEVSPEEEEILLTIPAPNDCINAEGPSWDACTSLRTGALRALVERCRQLGIVPFHDRDAQTFLLLGLAQIAQSSTVAFVYLFPFRAGSKGLGAKTLGMCICATLPLPHKAIEFLWTVNDIIFNEYLEDVVTDMELHIQEAIAHHRGPAEAMVRPRNPVSPNVWKSARGPAILVVVSTQLELDTLIELAGIRSSMEHRRQTLGTVFPIELGFKELPVWAVCTARAGSETPGGSLSTIMSALVSLQHKPYAVIMPGIAFGLQKRKQRLGDILISDRICTYEMQKLKPRVKINRDFKPSANTTMLRLIKTCQPDWNLETLDAERPSIDYGLVMSGEKLVNDPEFVAELLNQEPEALGGEMEASGLYAGAEEHCVRWIMMKAICDWGMGKGDEFQALAAKNSIDFLFHILKQPVLVEAIKKDNLKLLGK